MIQADYQVPTYHKFPPSLVMHQTEGLVDILMITRLPTFEGGDKLVGVNKIYDVGTEETYQSFQHEQDYLTSDYVIEVDNFLTVDELYQISDIHLRHRPSYMNISQLIEFWSMDFILIRANKEKILDKDPDVRSSAIQSAMVFKKMDVDSGSKDGKLKFIRKTAPVDYTYIDRYGDNYEVAKILVATEYFENSFMSKPIVINETVYIEMTSFNVTDLVFK